MVKTHTINLNTSAFNQFEKSDYIIIDTKDKDIEVNDFILFNQVETVEDKTEATGLYRLTQVTNIISDQGLKDGYSLLIVKKY
jgi:hypothetical protein